jgi:hypothetical protein
MRQTHSGHGVWLSRSTRALLAITCALLALLGASNAQASAPMCNELAQTIEAPPLMFHHDGGTIKADDCAPDHFANAPPGSPHRANTLDPGFVLKLTPTRGVVVAARARPPRRPITAVETAPHPGHSGSVYRPPRRA